MPITLTDEQTALTHSVSPSLVALLKITTYTNYDAQTVDDEFYYASVPVRYRWGTTVVQFQAGLKKVGPLVRGMEHIPSPSGVDATDEVTIELESTGTDPTKSTWTTLFDEANLIGATVEIGALLVDWDARSTTDFLDQSLRTTINGQDETDYDYSPTTEGVFSGGTVNHAVDDVITLTNGVNIIVTSVAGGGATGAVDGFTVVSDADTGVLNNFEALDQVTSTGSGLDFVLFPNTDNLTILPTHIVKFRGSILQIPDRAEESTTITLLAQTLEPSLKWATATNANEVSARDLGKRYPWPVGAAKRVPLIQREVGWVTTLTEAITDVQTGAVGVTSTEGLTATFTAMIGSERVTGTVTDATTISLVSRGANIGGLIVTAIAHHPGALIIEELDAATFVYSGVPNLALDALYALSPVTGQQVLIPPEFYSTVIADTVLEPGHELGTVAFTRELWARVIQLLADDARVDQQPDARVTQQPTVVHTAEPYETILIFFSGFAATTDSGALNCSTSIALDSFGMAMDYDGGLGGTDALRMWCVDGGTESQSRTVYRYRAVIQCRIEGDGSNPTLCYGKGVGSPWGHSQAQELLFSYDPPTNQNLFTTVSMDWNIAPASTTIADIVNNHASPDTSGPAYHTYLRQAAGTSAQTEWSVFTTNGSFWEVEVVAPAAATIGDATIVTDDDVIISAAATYGFNLDLFADVRGAVTLGAETSYDIMDNGVANGWVGSNCAIVDVSPSGFSMFVESESRQHTATLFGISPALDLSAARVKFDYKLTAGTQDAMDYDNDMLEVRLESSTNNWTRWGWNKSVLHTASGLTPFTFDPTNSDGNIEQTGLGTLDLSDVTRIIIGWRSASSSGSTGDGALELDNFRTEANTYHTHPIDVAKWVIEEQAGEIANAAHFTTAAARVPGVVVGGDLRSAGVTFFELLSRLGYESRTNFITHEEPIGGIATPARTEWFAYNADANYDHGYELLGYDVSIGSAEDGEGIAGLYTTTRRLEERPTEFLAAYDLREDLPSNELGGYQKLLQANATTNDISAAVPTADITAQQALVGVRQSDPIPFMLLNDSASVAEVWAYYVKTALQGKFLRCSMRVDYRVGYALQPGDVVTFAYPGALPTLFNWRVLSVEFPFDDPMIGLILEQVDE
jgi:hypothetical protein